MGDLPRNIGSYDEGDKETHKAPGKSDLSILLMGGAAPLNFIYVRCIAEIGGPLRLSSEAPPVKTFESTRTYAKYQRSANHTCDRGSVKSRRASQYGFVNQSCGCVTLAQTIHQEFRGKV